MDIIMERIISELKLQDKKQIDVTNFLGLSQNAFGSWKAGRNKAYLKYLYQIAEFLDVSVEYLKGETDEKNTASKEQKPDGNMFSEADREFFKYYADMTETDKQWLLGLIKSVKGEK